MRKLYNILALIVLFGSLMGCYEDKGNYDYLTLPKPIISGLEERYDVYIGDKLQIKPEITFEEGKPEIKNYEYSWILDAKEVSKEKNLDVVVNLAPGVGTYATYTVRDVDNGVSTIYKFEVYAQTLFKEGWLILSELDGIGQLSYQRPDNVFYEDIYNLINGEKLSNNPVKLREHWLPFSVEMGQVNVICKGGPDYSVELDGSSFAKIIANKDEFVGGKAPANFAPVDAWYVSGFDILSNDDGKMYTRSIDGSIYSAKYQQGSFADVPSHGDYQLSKWSMRGSPYYFDEIISYDVKNKRYVVISNGTVNDFRTEMDVNKAFDVKNMNKEVVSGDVNIHSSPNVHFVTILKDFNSSSYFMHRFNMNGWSAPRYFLSTSETLINDGGLINSDTKFAFCKNRPYIFLTNGSKLYRYNIDTNEVPILINDYGKKIQSMAINWASDRIGMVIGDSDKGNDFITIDVSIIGDGKILTEKKGVCGKGIDVLYKVGDQSVFPF